MEGINTTQPQDDRQEIQTPGRSCPLHYRYQPKMFATEPSANWSGLDVLYVVGGLYGNELALHEVLRLFEREHGRKRLLFNGDFHWFDVDPIVFERIQQGVLAHAALRGNVETELADGYSSPSDAGCGCAYPEWVSDAVVERSNRILQRLRQTTTPETRRQLAALPMGLRASVGAMQIAVVHGDAESLAGWGFSQESLRDPEQQARVRDWFALAQVQAFACAHTCLPVFQRFPSLSQPAFSKGDPTSKAHWVLNNGAAGMPNFEQDLAGLFTRIALSPFAGPQRRAGVVEQGVYMEAIALAVDTQDAWQRFLAQWPQGSDAYLSYSRRILHGPSYTLDQMIR